MTRIEGYTSERTPSTHGLVALALQYDTRAAFQSGSGRNELGPPN